MKNTYTYSIDDINKDTARNAFAWSSFDPEKRGERTRRDYFETVKEFAEWLDKLDNLSEEEKRVNFEDFRNGFIAKFNSWLSSQGRCASSAITGGSGFNTVRAERANLAEHNKSVELWGFPEYYQKKIEKLIRRREEAKTTEAEKAIIKGLKSISELAVCGANSYLPPLERSKFVNYFFNHLHEFTLEETQTIVDTLQTAEADNKYKLITTKSKIFIALERKKAEKPQTEEEKLYYKNDIVEVIKNREAKRFQAFFDGKPESNIIAKLKELGFRWSPRAGAWQQYYTSNGKYKIDTFLTWLKEYIKGGE